MLHLGPLIKFCMYPAMAGTLRVNWQGLPVDTLCPEPDFIGSDLGKVLEIVS